MSWLWAAALTDMLTRLVTLLSTDVFHHVVSIANSKTQKYSIGTKINM